MAPYPVETYPENVKYVLDTPYNRSILTNKYGESRLGIINNQTYLEINVKDQTWRPTFDFQWLYRNPPPLIILEEL